MKNLSRIFMFFLVFCFSCKQEKTEIAPDFISISSKESLCKIAKQEYKNQYSKNSTPTSVNHQKSIFWEDSFVQNVNGQNLLITPVKIFDDSYTYLEEGSKISLSNASLLVSAISSESTKFEIVTKIPDQTYLLSEKNYPEFTGLVLVEDIFGNYEKGFQVKERNISYAVDKGSRAYNKSNKKLNTASYVQCIDIDWYSCSGGTCSYVYTDSYCTGSNPTSTPMGMSYGTIGEGNNGGGSSSGSTTTAPPADPSTTPATGYAGLCPGPIAWSKIGNSYTAQVTELGITGLYTGEPDPIHTPEGSAISVTFANSCITMPGYNLTASQASEQFAGMFNYASYWIDRELNDGTLRPTYAAVRSRLLVIIRDQFSSLHPGGSFTVGTCSGNVAVSRAGYGC